MCYLKSPLEPGARMWCRMDQLPALSPAMVTRAASPPKWRMFSCTQWRASCWSRRP